MVCSCVCVCELNVVVIVWTFFVSTPILSSGHFSKCVCNLFGVTKILDGNRNGNGNGNSCFLSVPCLYLIEFHFKLMSIY